MNKLWRNYKRWILTASVVFIIFLIIGYRASLPPSQTPLEQAPVATVATPLNNDQIISEVKPAVVYIETDDGSGSGMIYKTNSSYSLVLTNAHVVEGFSTAKVTISTGDTYTATVLGMNEIADVAVLKINAIDLPTVAFGDSGSLSQGDPVFSLGYPFGLSDGAAFTNGIVSKVNLTLDDGTSFIENTAEIHPGNSGGPLVDQYGEVIGITTGSYTDQVVKDVQLGETIKLAIPINSVKGLIAGLETEQPLPKPKKIPLVVPPAPSTTVEICPEGDTCTPDPNVTTQVGDCPAGYTCTPVQQVLPQPKVLTPPPPPEPENGTVSVAKSAYLQGDGTLKIVNETGNDQSDDAVAELVSGSTLVYKVYIRAGNTYTIQNISDGSYQLAFCFGTNCEEFDDPFSYVTTVSDNGNYQDTQYATYTITLNPVTDGNAQTSSMSSQQFNSFQ